jgi:hypothetical protein
VYDVERVDSFENLQTWLKEVELYSPNNGESVVKLLVGNKIEHDQGVCFSWRHPPKLVLAYDKYLWKWSKKCWKILKQVPMPDLVHRLPVVVRIVSNCDQVLVVDLR